MKTSHDRLLRLIALFKFFKAAMLIALGVGAFHLIHKDLGEVLEHWTEALRLDPGNRFVDVALAKASICVLSRSGNWGWEVFCMPRCF